MNMALSNINVGEGCSVSTHLF